MSGVRPENHNKVTLSSHMRTLIFITAIAVALGIAARGSAGSPAPHCVAGPIQVYSFTVETEWGKKQYRPGEKAEVEVTVTRPGPEDPQRQGLPWPVTERFPAEGATVSAFVQDYFPPVGSYGETDENGVTSIAFKVPSRLHGPVSTYTKATKYYRSGGPDCTDLEESGSKTDSPAFIVTD